MDPPLQTPRLLALPFELRMQIWHHAINLEVDLAFCPCIDLPQRAAEVEICACQHEAAIPGIMQLQSPIDALSSLPKRSKSDLRLTSKHPHFLHEVNDVGSSLPLTSRLIYADTLPLVQPQKHLTFCSTSCMNSLLSVLAPHQIQRISLITISIDLRVFRPPPTSSELASFHDIWKCIYTTRLSSEKAIRRFFPSPTVERMNAGLIVPDLDFYLLDIATGRPFCRSEREEREHWVQQSNATGKVEELRQIVGNRSREGLPVPSVWRRGGGAGDRLRTIGDVTLGDRRAQIRH